MMWTRFKAWGLAAAACVAFAVPATAEASKLGGVRSSVSGSSSSSSSSSSGSSSSSSRSSWSSGSVSGSKLGGVRSDVRGSGSAHRSGHATGGNRVVGSFGASTGVYAVGSPLDVESDEGVYYDGHHHEVTSALTRRNTVPLYRRHPYAERSEGYIVREPPHTRDSRGRLVAGQAAVEGAYAGDGVWRSGAQVRLTFSRLGLDSNLSFYIDQGMTDAIYLGSTNLMLAPVLRPHVVWWVGGGANYLLDGRDPRQGGEREYAAGYNLMSSVDVFPFSPFVLSGRVDAGTLHAARVLSARATVGVLLRGFELYGGYELKKVGDVPLHGPMLGIRAWF
jgi:hypothetical protein